jgi:hypothetical protein
MTEELAGQLADEVLRLVNSTPQTPSRAQLVCALLPLLGDMKACDSKDWKPSEDWQPSKEQAHQAAKAEEQRQRQRDMAMARERAKAFDGYRVRAFDD